LYNRLFFGFMVHSLLVIRFHAFKMHWRLFINSSPLVQIISLLGLWTVTLLLYLSGVYLLNSLSSHVSHLWVGAIE